MRVIHTCFPALWSDLTDNPSNYRLLPQMKKIAAILLAAGITGSSLSAQEESSYSITMDFPFVSEYVFRGVTLGSEAIQPSIEFASGDFYAGIWSSQPVISGDTNEFDFYFGYGFSLSDTWALDVGFTYYYYPQTPSGDEQQEPYVGISGDLGGGWSTSFYGYYDFETEATTAQADLGYSMEMSDASTFDIAATFGSVFVSGGDYNYYGISGTVNYAINDIAGTYVGVVYADNDIGGGVEDGFVYFIAGISMGF